MRWGPPAGDLMCCSLSLNKTKYIPFYNLVVVIALLSSIFFFHVKVHIMESEININKSTLMSVLQITRAGISTYSSAVIMTRDTSLFISDINLSVFVSQLGERNSSSQDPCWRQKEEILAMI